MQYTPGSGVPHWQHASGTTTPYSSSSLIQPLSPLDLPSPPAVSSPTSISTSSSSTSSSSRSTKASHPRLASLRAGLAEYRTRAKEHWQAQQFFHAMQKADSIGSTSPSFGRNSRMEGMSFTYRMRAVTHRTWQSILRCPYMLCGILSALYAALWKDDSKASSISELQQRTDRRTTRLVWMLVIAAFLYWYFVALQPLQ